MAHPLTRHVRWRRSAAAAGIILAILAVAPVSAGNNGTLKVLANGSPVETPDNEPEVGCVFFIEAFGLDPNQDGTLILSTQGGDGPVNLDVTSALGPANADGYAIAFFQNVVTGHYSAVFYGKDGDPEAKAKSKVFKVTCDGGGGG